MKFRCIRKTPYIRSNGQTDRQPDRQTEMEAYQGEDTGGNGHMKEEEQQEVEEEEEEEEEKEEQGDECMCQLVMPHLCLVKGARMGNQVQVQPTCYLG